MLTNEPCCKVPPYNIYSIWCVYIWVYIFITSSQRLKLCSDQPSSSVFILIFILNISYLIPPNSMTWAATTHFTALSSLWKRLLYKIDV